MIRRWMSLVSCVLVSCAANSPSGHSYRPDITDDLVMRVVTGDTSEMVKQKLGEPQGRVRFENLRATSWDYRYRDTWGYWVDLAIMIGDDGRVQGKVAARLDPPGKD